MRRLLLLTWLLIPLGFAAFHYGPGQTAMQYDQTAHHLRQAETDVASEDYSQAILAYDQALSSLPAGQDETARRITLERAKARMLVGELPTAHDELVALQEELTDRPLTDPLRRETERALAHSRHYLVWLMRLEGRPREEWQPEIESARQMLRALTETADSVPVLTTVARTNSGGADMTPSPTMATKNPIDALIDEVSFVSATTEPETATTLAQDLEASIRLERIGLDELQALPLPKQCKNCCSKESKCCGTCKKPGRKNGTGQKKPEDARGASGGPPPDNSGS